MKIKKKLLAQCTLWLLLIALLPMSIPFSGLFMSNAQSEEAQGEEEASPPITNIAYTYEEASALLSPVFPSVQSCYLALSPNAPLQYSYIEGTEKEPGITVIEIISEAGIYTIGVEGRYFDSDYGESDSLPNEILNMPFHVRGITWLALGYFFAPPRGIDISDNMNVVLDSFYKIEPLIYESLGTYTSRAILYTLDNSSEPLAGGVFPGGQMIVYDYDNDPSDPPYSYMIFYTVLNELEGGRRAYYALNYTVKGTSIAQISLMYAGQDE